MAKKQRPSLGENGTLIAENRRARFDFAVEDTFEAGIQLLGTEVKALREGRPTSRKAMSTWTGRKRG